MSKATVKENPLGTQPVEKLLVSFSVPAIISILVNSLYNMADQIFISRGVGYLGNAATTVVLPLMTVAMALATFMGPGAGAYAAQCLGRGDTKEANRTLNNLLVLSVAIGVVGMVLGFIFLEPLLRLFGATDKILPYAVDYASVILLGLPFNIVGIALTALTRTDGSPRLSMYGMLIGVVLNLVLDPLYIFVFGWGVKGAALATVTCQIISFCVIGQHFVFHGRQMRFQKSMMKLSPNTCRSFITLGISSGVGQIVNLVMQVAVNNALVIFGAAAACGSEVALSGMGIVLKISQMLFAFSNGIAVGMQPIVGFNLGAKQYRRIRRAYLMAVGGAVGLLFLGWLGCQLAPELIIGIFGEQDPQFTAFTVRCLRIFLALVFVDGFRTVSNMYFQAAGYPLKASVLSLVRHICLLTPLAYILPQFFGLDGVLYAGPAADLTAALITLVLILPELKKLNQKIRQTVPQT